MVLILFGLRRSDGGANDCTIATFAHPQNTTFSEKIPIEVKASRDILIDRPPF
jgi:hypothetical protein